MPVRIERSQLQGLVRLARVRLSSRLLLPVDSDVCVLVLDDVASVPGLQEEAGLRGAVRSGARRGGHGELVDARESLGEEGGLRPGFG